MRQDFLRRLLISYVFEAIHKNTSTHTVLVSLLKLTPVKTFQKNNIFFKKNRIYRGFELESSA